jgi:hypothetical protein
MLANARSYSLGLLLQSAPICCAIGSGKISSSPRATPGEDALGDVGRARLRNREVLDHVGVDRAGKGRVDLDVLHLQLRA